MKKLSASTLLLAGATSLAALAQNRDTTLESLKHVARPILIFGSAGDSRVVEQLRDLAPNAGAIRERDIRIIQIPTSTATMGENGLPVVTLSQTEQEQVRKRFGISQDGFSIVLVGKDGGKKLRSATPLAWQKLEETIDSMPMRQDEVQGR